MDGAPPEPEGAVVNANPCAARVVADGSQGWALGRAEAAEGGGGRSALGEPLAYN